MRLLITRPIDDAEALMAVLKSRGHDPIAAPVMTIDYLSGPVLDLSGVQALIATSGNGVRALAARTDNRDIILFAVGDATMREATKVGFQHCLSAAGNVETLAKLIIETADPSKGALFHAAGETLAGDLGGLLEGAGFTYQRETLYRAVPVETLSNEALKVLSGGTADGVLIYSPRSARLFCDMVQKVGCASEAKSFRYFCLSQAVADALDSLQPSDVEVASQPNQDNLLSLIGSA